MTRQIVVLATAVILTSGHIAEATPMTYNFEGTVTTVAVVPPGIPLGITVGEQVPISITVDPSAPIPYQLVSALFNNVDQSSYASQSINIQIGSSISFQAISPMVGGGFELALTGAYNGVLTSGMLPALLNPGDFTGGVFEVRSLFLPLLGSSVGYSGTINGFGTIALVPEPSSLLLISAGLVGIGWQAVRRRKIEQS